MDRLACISLPALALQVALRRMAPGPSQPLVLVKQDKPASPIVNLNREARALGLRSGMRYSEALALVCDLQAVTVSPRQLDEARQEILEILSRWSPLVESCPYDQGSFWVGTAGLASLYGTEAQWGVAVRSALAQCRYSAVVVVGLSRGGTYVLARARRRSTVVTSAQAEARALEQAPLSLFPIGLRQRRLLQQLGIMTWAGVMNLPADSLSRRLGPEVIRNLRQLQEWSTLPLQSSQADETLVRYRRLETPLTDVQALVPLLEAPLDEGLVQLVRQARVLTELRVVFVLESHAMITEVVRPAEPTTSRAMMVRLLQLRLSRGQFTEGIIEVRLAFQAAPLTTGSGDLFAPPVVRSLRRGAEAVAVIQAQWGNACVVRPLLVDSHLPDQSFVWEEVVSLKPPQPFPPGPMTAVRRIGLVPPQNKSNPSGQRLGGPCHLRMVSHGKVVDREYWFLRTVRQEVLWVSCDCLTRESRWEGVVD